MVTGILGRGGMEGFESYSSKCKVDQDTHPLESIPIPQGTGEESDTRGNIVAGWLVVSTRKVGPNHTAQADYAVINLTIFGANFERSSQ